MAPDRAVIEVVEGDPAERRRLSRFLRQAGYRVAAASQVASFGGGPTGRQCDACIVAVSDRAGLAAAMVALASRAVAVIVLAPRAGVNVVEALGAGADDYVAQPADPDELLARLRAVLRRSGGDRLPAPMVTTDFTLDLGQRRLTRRGHEVHLTPTEWQVLDLLARHPGRLVSHDQMLRSIWGLGKLDRLVYLRVYIASLRRKLEPDRTAPRYLLTEPGYGYRFRLSSPT